MKTWAAFLEYLYSQHNKVKKDIDKYALVDNTKYAEAEGRGGVLRGILDTFKGHIIVKESIKYKVSKVNEILEFWKNHYSKEHSQLLKNPLMFSVEDKLYIVHAKAMMENIWGKFKGIPHA